MDRPRLAVIIPALNEEGSIGAVVHQCLYYGLTIVVDDGSCDRTAEISEKEGADVVRHSIKRGYDAALNSGFKRAVELGCDFVITIDADGQHDPQIIHKYIDLLCAGADIVVGVRDRHQRFAEYCFSFMTKFMYGLSDPLCGLKGYRMSVYQSLGHFDSYASIGTELTLFAALNGFRLEQVKIIMYERDGIPRFGRRLYANYKIFRAMFLFFVMLVQARLQ